MFKGVIPILQTPFDEDGGLDLASLRREVRYVCDAGADGMAFPGFVSEWWKLSDAEILRGAEVIREESAGRALAIFNVTEQSTYLAVEQAKAFARLGCDGLMCLPPFVVAPGGDAVVTHLEHVIDAADVPHILQYSASLTGVKLSLEQMARLRDRHPQFRCIKVDFIPPGPMISNLVNAFGAEAFTFLIGFAGLQLPDCLVRGAHGLMGGAGHLAEDLAVFRALIRDRAEGLAAFRALLPLINLEMQTVDMSIALHKHLLVQRGVIASDHVRAPGPNLDAVQVEELRQHMAFLTQRRPE
jgi:dihydrodipicolinate synthase/N-acetylneuraminate lyase